MRPLARPGCDCIPLQHHSLRCDRYPSTTGQGNVGQSWGGAEATHVEAFCAMRRVSRHEQRGHTCRNAPCATAFVLRRSNVGQAFPAFHLVGRPVQQASSPRSGKLFPPWPVTQYGRTSRPTRMPGANAASRPSYVAPVTSRSADGRRRLRRAMGCLRRVAGKGCEIDRRARSADGQRADDSKWRVAAHSFPLSGLLSFAASVFCPQTARTTRATSPALTLFSFLRTPPPS